MIDPLSNFLACIKASEHVGWMKNAVVTIYAVVCFEKFMPPRVAEAVSELAKSAEIKVTADGGLASVFMGLAQGKRLIKAANAGAATIQKGG